MKRLLLPLLVALALPTTVNAHKELKVKGELCDKNSQCKSGNCIPRWDNLEGPKIDCNRNGKRKEDRSPCKCG